MKCIPNLRSTWQIIACKRSRILGFCVPPACQLFTEPIAVHPIFPPRVHCQPWKQTNTFCWSKSELRLGYKESTRCISYFSTVTTQDHDKATYKRKCLIWLIISEDWHLWWQRKGLAGRKAASSYLDSQVVGRVGILGMVWFFWNVKVTSRDTPTLIRPHLLILSKQFQQSGTKYSVKWACGGHSHSSHCKKYKALSHAYVWMAGPPPLSSPILPKSYTQWGTHASPKDLKL